MSMLRLFVFFLLVAGCVSVRPLGNGDVGLPLNADQTGAVLSAGAGAFHSSAKAIDGDWTNVTLGGSMTGAIPYFEGSIQHAFSRWIMLDLHGSGSGLDTGVRFRLPIKGVALSVQPSLGLGLAGSWARSMVSGPAALQTEYSDVSWMLRVAPALRLQCEWPSGWYAALAVADQVQIDLQYSEATNDIDETAVIGFRIPVSEVTFMPEITAVHGNQPGAESWSFFAGVSVALAAPMPNAKPRVIPHFEIETIPGGLPPMETPESNP